MDQPGGQEAVDPALLAWQRAQDGLAAGDGAGARHWLERARRLVPDDKLVAMTLGSVRLADGDADGAVALLARLAGTVPAAAAALAAAQLERGDDAAARAALAVALQGSLVGPALAALADRITPAWCGLGADGRVRWGRTVPFPVDATAEDSLVVEGPQGPFVGSPLPLRRLRGTEGIVALEGGALTGWAWRPADPDTVAALVATGPGGRHPIAMDGPAEGVEAMPPLARPQRFVVPAAVVAGLGSPVTVTDAAGCSLLGSPVWPGAASARFSERGAFRVGPAAAAVDVVVPVHGAAAETLACLRSVLASLPPGSLLHVVDDGSPDPTLRQTLREMAAGSPAMRLHVHPTPRGFPAAANAGLAAAAGRDAVLLNSDTVVPPGWLERLRVAAHRADDIGSVTPLTGDGSIVSYRGPGPAVRSAAVLDALARRLHPGESAELPVGVGFCLYLRRDCLDQVGPLREDLFAQGYGEESEFCARARRFGWRHVAALDVFVSHRGGASFSATFGAARAALRRRNQAILERLHPEYAGWVAAFERDDPLFPARRRMASAQWAAARPGRAVVLVSHGEGGGVAELVRARAAAWRRDGVRPLVLVPAPGGCAIEGAADLRFAMPAELPLLAGLLRAEGATQMEVHHLRGHDHAVLGLAGLLGVPVETWVHDASPFCPRVALIGRERRYCGEPSLAGCEACVAVLGTNLLEPIGPTALVERSAADLARSRRVVVPTADTGRRLQRHFPAVRPEVVPWEDDAALPPVEASASGGPVRVVVVGAIGVEKGYDVLLACAADARARGLPLDFVVCGRTEDDERLMAAGPVFVTGRYDPAGAVELIRAQGGQLAFLPSIWPETWCFALSWAWEAGLPAVAFDLGAPAERIRAAGEGERGWLLPLGLPAPRVNDALLRLASARAGLQPSRARQPDRTSCQSRAAPAP